jgi:RNA polymerase sigma-70 factor (ECF subfamily)
MDAQTEPAALVNSTTFHFDFDDIFHSQYPRIARVISRIVKDFSRAEELSVEVFWKLSRTTRAQGPDVNGWLYRTAVRQALDELRKQCRREKYERLFSVSRPTSMDHPEFGRERQDCVRAILGKIARRSAEMLVLRSEGFSYEEIAQVLGLNPSSVGTLLSRAQQAFRKEYIKRYGQP